MHYGKTKQHVRKRVLDAPINFVVSFAVDYWSIKVKEKKILVNQSIFSF